MILRILRYISPQPWGSTRAQAGRRRESLERIVQRVWDPDPTSDSRLRFEAGANVLWTPFRICVDGRLRHEPPRPRPGERFGWLASRTPLSRDAQLGFERDVGAEVVVVVRGANGRVVEVLQDNRFLITFRLDAIPTGDPVMASLEEGWGRVMLVLQGRWLWPQVVWRREGEKDVVLARISAPELDWYEPAPGARKTYSTRLSSEKAPEEPLPWQDAVDFKFIRVLDEP
jgi:tRNA(Ile)-lysidine synthase